MDRKLSHFGFFVMGSGPGHPDLLTLMAYKVLKKADVVLYDNLSSAELLKIAPKTCKLIYVGKKPYENCTPQEVINDLIVKYTKLYPTVIRLKGGDPFIFGRGFEESLFAEEHGIRAHYIPGISSMQGAGFLDIPLTHRGISESLWAITGTKCDGSLSSDLKCAINSSATVVIYMGMRKLREISKTYEEVGLGHIPAAIIQNATHTHQRHLTCEVKDLQDAAFKNGLSNPAIIVIGNVVKAREIIASRKITAGLNGYIAV